VLNSREMDLKSGISLFAGCGGDSLGLTNASLELRGYAI